MTRRATKPQPQTSNEPIVRFPKVGHFYICPDLFPTTNTVGKVIVHCEARGTCHHMGQQAFIEKCCRYGVPGDFLWVKEALHSDEHGQMTYADGEHVMSETAPVCPVRWPKEWKVNKHGAMYCPRWASRLTLQVESVKVERLGDITEADAIAEGIHCDPCGRFQTAKGIGCFAEDPRLAFRWLWESINGAESWTTNPWVWAVSFRRITP